MAKICMVHIDHSPLDVRVFYKETLSLSKAGFDVITLCAADTEGNVYDMGNSKILNKDQELDFVLEGFQFHAVKRAATRKQKLLNKVFQSDFFKDLIQKGVEINADVYHAHEAESYYIALKIQEQTGAKVVLDAHESWQGEGKKSDYIRMNYLHKLRYLISANPMTKGNLMTLNRNIQAEVIYNFSVKKDFNIPFNEHKFDNPILVHEGYLPFNRGLKEMVEVVHLLKEDFPNIKFKIIGKTKGEEAEYLKAKKEACQLEDNIIETGWVDYEAVASHLSDCAIGLICKSTRPNNILGGPAIKLFNYFASGLAVVDFNLPESTYFLNKINAGISVQERSVEKLAEAIKILLSDHDLLKRYCRNAYAAFHNQFNWESEEKKLISFYKNVVLNESGLHVR